MSEEYLTTHEAARLLRLKERRLYDLVRQGLVPASRAGGRWLFPRAALERWLAGERGPAPAAASLRPPVIAGSHDPLLEWAMREADTGLGLLPEGSGAGLARFFRGEALVAGTHLLDPETGGYNVKAIVERGSAEGCVLVAWAERVQGLVLPKGNPSGVTGLADLAGRPLVRRQADSGSHVLLAYLWQQAGLDPAQLILTEETARAQSDLGLAVLEGRAEAGLAVEAAAKSLKLDFLPLWRERFDLVMTRRDFFEPPLQKLFAFARRPAFAAKAQALGGYDIAALGEVRWNAA